MFMTNVYVLERETKCQDAATASAFLIEVVCFSVMMLLALPSLTARQAVAAVFYYLRVPVIFVRSSNKISETRMTDSVLKQVSNT